MLTKLKCVLVSAAMLLLVSCSCHFSSALKDTCDFYPVEQEDSRYDVYLSAGQYYLLCDVSHVCEYEKLSYGAVMVAPDDAESFYLPISVKREPVQRRYYVRLSPEAALGLLGVKVAPAPEDTPYCIAEEDWDATAAKKIASKVKLSQVSVLDGDELCRYYDDATGTQCYLFVPKYKPWDYWVKMPLCGLLLVGVDVPCTVLGSVGVIVGDMMIY